MLPLPPTKIASTLNLNLFDMISYLESPIIVGTCDNFLATYDCGKRLLLMQLLSICMLTKHVCPSFVAHLLYFISDIYIISQIFPLIIVSPSQNIRVLKKIYSIVRLSVQVVP